MEINARVYAVALSRELLEQVHEVLTEMTPQRWYSPEILDPCAVLPLSRRWYGFTERAAPTYGPEKWTGCLEDCAQILGKNGAVVVEYRSPDHPDDYLEYAYTTPGGGAGIGRRPGLIGYARALGNRDVSLAIDELVSERTAWDREKLCRRMERKEAVRREKGDFEIGPDGILKKYRGHDTEVVIPEGVKEIGQSAFVDLDGVERMLVECEDYDAPEMEKLTIPDGVEKISDYAFAYCQNLISADIPDSVRVIGDRAFEGCESLKKVRLPEGLKEIEEYTFFLCFDLKSIAIPDSVTRIGRGAFDGCSLSRISLPDGLISIGDEAFSGCSFRKVRIPESVIEIGKNAFPKETQVYRGGAVEADDPTDAEEDEDEEEYEYDPEEEELFFEEYDDYDEDDDEL